MTDHTGNMYNAYDGKNNAFHALADNSVGQAIFLIDDESFEKKSLHISGNFMQVARRKMRMKDFVPHKVSERYLKIVISLRFLMIPAGVRTYSLKSIAGNIILVLNMHVFLLH
ncbi:hypothetical protein ACFGOO_06705 [Treponema vincentii]|uniref:hypothetical protein n=1 Tax=Treponema vincentii TaxID=69710 RepID=UPI0035F5AA97